MPGSSSSRTSFASLRVDARDAAAAERAAAEAFEAGASGLEERDAGEGVTLFVYAPAGAMPALRQALAAACGSAVRLGAPEPVAEADWSEAWKAGLAPIVVSPRLVVRPSFVAATASNAAEIVIDPGQAFGTGGHASTRLALEWIDAHAARLPGARVLDAGCGSGVLALAALRLGARTALAFDLDPLATAAAASNAAANGLAAGLRVFTGPLEALAAAPFDLVLANMLSREFLPLVAGLAARTAPGGVAVFSGLLAEEREKVVAALTAVGLGVRGERDEVDANGDRWLALLTTR
jgi:ribosomal protein L11 methyltransferase